MAVQKGRLSAWLFDPLTDEPVVGTVTVRQAGAVIVKSATWEDGCYSTRLLVGDYEVSAVARDRAAQTQVVVIGHRRSSDLLFPLAVTPPPPPPPPSGTIAGRVSQESGAPIAGATVSVTDPASYTVATDDDGNYGTPGLPDGAYVVRASHPDYLEASRQVQVAAGQVARADFALAPNPPPPPPPPPPATGRSLRALVTASPPVTGGDVLRLTLFAGHPGAVTLEARGVGWYRLLEGATILRDRTAVDNRPRGTGSRRTYTWEVSAPLYRGWRNIEVKVWADGQPEPAFADSLVWQSEDPDLAAAEGGVIVSAPGWTILTLFSEEIPELVPPTSVTPYRPYDLTKDAGIWFDGRDVSLPLALTLARVTAATPTVHFEPGGVYGNEQKLRLAGLIPGLTLDGHGGAYGAGGAIFRRSDPALVETYLSMEYLTGPTLRGFEVWGNEPTDPRYDPVREFSQGLVVQGGIGGLVEDYYAHHVGGDAIVGGHVGAREPTRLLTVRRGKSRNARRQGESYNFNDGLLVEDQDIADCGRSAIDIEPYIETRYVRGAVFRRITAVRYWNYGFACRADDFTLETFRGAGGLGLGEFGGRGFGSRTRIMTVVDDPGNTASSFRVSIQLSAGAARLLPLLRAAPAEIHEVTDPEPGGPLFVRIGEDGEVLPLWPSLGAGPVAAPSPDGRIDVGRYLQLSNGEIRQIVESAYDPATGLGSVVVSPGFPAAPAGGDSFSTGRLANFIRLSDIEYEGLDPDRPRDGAGGGMSVRSEELTISGLFLRRAQEAAMTWIAPICRLSQVRVEKCAGLEIDTAGRGPAGVELDRVEVFRADGTPAPVTVR